MAILAQGVECFFGSWSISAIVTSPAGSLLNSFMMAGCAIVNVALVQGVVEGYGPFFVFEQYFFRAVVSDCCD